MSAATMTAATVLRWTMGRNARIYDRILERCAPILFAGKNFREENAGATKQAAKDIVNRKSD